MNIPDEIKDIGHIQFGILSPEDIINMSVVEIKSNKLSNGNTVGSVYDPRLGPLKPREICPTCGDTSDYCPGHFGHIVLNTYIIHPLYYRMVLSFLKCFCNHCYRLLVTEEHLKLWNFMKLKGENRFEHIVEKILKLKTCLYCGVEQPKYTLCLNDSSFIATYKIDNVIERMKLSDMDIRRIFIEIVDEDITLLGFNPQYIHPKNLILSVLPVIPTKARPYIVTENIVCDDDITIQLCEIIKANNHLLDNNITETKLDKYTQTLKFRIKTMMDNSQCKAKHTNSRPMKGLKERICSKDGLIRNNLMGKRVDFSARTVIGPDPTLKMNEIAIPNEIADILAYPVKVTPFNIEEMRRIVCQTQDAINLQRGLQRFSLKYAKFKPEQIQVGDVIERKLQNGDIVFLNRQPTLHLGSMLAQRIVRRPGKTIRMNLAVCKSFNSDFDGDEMNIFPPTSELSRAELIEISDSGKNIIGVSASRSIMTIVQDSLLGVYLMTKRDTEIPRYQFLNIIECVYDASVQQRLDEMRAYHEEEKLDFPFYSGKTLFSIVLPNSFIYTCKNNARKDEPIVRINRGYLLSGAINKGNLDGHTSIIRLLHKEYGSDMALDFINRVQFIVREFLMYHGFSIGIEDCTATKTDEIQHVIIKSFMEADGIEKTTHNAYIREAKINLSLSKAKDVGMKLAKDTLKEDNNFLDTVTSGSKGDFFNIAQIMGLLGQQNITGKRVQYHLNKGRRSLPHYPLRGIDKKLEFESKGFIRHSFFKGLSPTEFWFHAMSGREGITDTALKTAQSGYIQRKMIKIMEDIQIKYDQTVRNSVGSIVQFSYGSNNIDPRMGLVKDGALDICDVGRIADRLNLEYEINK
jgi:DNA-directed RNA polymerase beta' subunit